MNTNDDTKSKMNSIINNLNTSNSKSKENGTAPAKRPIERPRVEPREARSGIQSAFISRPGTPRVESNEFAVIGEYKIRISAVEFTYATSEVVYFYMASGATVSFPVGGKEYVEALAVHDDIDR